MVLEIEKTLGPFYCRSALRLCMAARMLCGKGECEKVSEICSYVSSLCSENRNRLESCYQESTICGKVAEYCRGGRATDGCKKGQLLCEEARKLCPQNNIVNGA